MKKQTIKGYSNEDALIILREHVGESSQKDFAAKHQLDPATLSSVLKGYRPIPGAMLKIIGLELKSVFVPVEKSEAVNG